MKRLGLLLALSPLGANAAASADTVHISTSSGIAAQWLGTTSGIAWGFVPLLFVIAMVVEAFGKPPTEPRDMGAVVWRLIVVLFLLTFYGKIFTGFSGLLEGVAGQISPADTWAKLEDASTRFLTDKRDYQLQQIRAEANNGSAVGVASELLTGNVDALGGALIDVVVSVILLLGQASFRIIGIFGETLKILLFVLGPLALVASIPRPSNAGAQWLRVFISVALWPLISALLVGLLSSYALAALTPKSSYDTAYKSIALAGLLCLCSFAVPVIASALTGAAMGAIGQGYSSGMMAVGMASRAGQAGASLGAAIAGAGAPAVGAGAQAASVAARAGGAAAPGGGAGGGGGGGRVASAAPSGPASPPPPQWATKWANSLGSPPASSATGGTVNPAGEVAQAQHIAQHGGVDFKDSTPASQPQPPPFKWSQGGINPAAADDDVPTVRPIPMAGPAAPRPPLGAAVVPAAEGAARPKSTKPEGGSAAGAAQVGKRSAAQPVAAKSPPKPSR